MRSLMCCRPLSRASAVVLGLLFLAARAEADWSQVAEVPPEELFSVWAHDDTLVVGGHTVIYLSTDAGATWLQSTTPTAGVAPILAARVRNGRLFAGTFGDGVHISDDLGTTWQAFNQGLVGGFLNSQLDVVDFAVRGESLFAATAGAGVYVRTLAGAGTWQTFGDVFEPNQASNLNALALGGDRLLASAGGNGMVFRRDPGETEWTISNLDNVGIHAGLQAGRAAWTGTGWVVGTNKGVFRSVAGQEPWTLFNPGLGPLNWTAFATQGGRLFVAFDIVTAAVIEESDDDGASWQIDDILPGVFVQQMAICHGNLYAARGDGLWRRSTESVSVAPGAAPARLRFAMAGPQPFGARTRLRFELPEAGIASIELFDVMGRTSGERIEQWWNAGPHEVALDAVRLGPGVYTARLTAGGRQEVLRLVHVR